jgi:hypothetical protein
LAVAASIASIVVSTSSPLTRPTDSGSSIAVSRRFGPPNPIAKYSRVTSATR